MNSMCYTSHSVAAEYVQSSAKDAAKEAARQETIRDLRMQIESLQTRLDMLGAPEPALTRVSKFPPLALPAASSAANDK